MKPYNVILQQEKEATVVTEYKRIISRSSSSYQSEYELEQGFIKLLSEQGYEYLNIKTEADLINNLRHQLESLNNYHFSDHEWDRFFNEYIGNKNSGIVEKSQTIQDDNVKVLKLDNNKSKNIKLIDKSNIHNNKLQVINQYSAENGKHKNIYDVTVLVNGFPMIHIELKRRGVALKEAFNQINRYQRESFWSDSGLFEFVQIFVISNGTTTKYYSNTTRNSHINDNNKTNKKSKTSNTFEFTIFWSDAKNKRIEDLVDFAQTFFAKHTILNILTRYCVFTSENKLLVMRPYQIVATERILNKIQIQNNYKKYGSVEAGGYIWHTTGSGKTLTSFKTARLASKLEYIDKVLFVVDRKDLDYQTMREYDRFEKGAANSNSSSEILKRQLEDPSKRIIITTIQKLHRFIAINKSNNHSVFSQKVVFIFDECHRSQFGEMHTAITKYFKKYFMFGFTGTPIFELNANTSASTYVKTTQQAFGDQLHSYTIIDAINDKNVLPFRIDYIKTHDAKEDIEDKKVLDIDRERVYGAPERISLVTKYILDHFNQKTYRKNKMFEHSVVSNISTMLNKKNKDVKEEHKNVLVDGFNSILAVSSIDLAKKYYNEFKKQMNEDPSKNIKVGIIFSYGANQDECDGVIDDENSEDTSNLDQSSREFLESAIQDYNKMFETAYDTSSERFQNFYKDVSMRMKNKELDLLIVVNMFLTGFDATTLNTLWVDKNLRMHGLLQAFSRTNRILNSIKTFGNIICFRSMETRVKDAISLFGNKDASGIILLRSFADYYYGFIDENNKRQCGYKDICDELLSKYPLSDWNLISESEKYGFIQLFSAFLRMKNLLSSFDDFENKQIISEFDIQDYSSRYMDLRDEMRNKALKADAENINDDIVFEIELLKQTEVNVDYVLALVKKYKDQHSKDKDLIIKIQNALNSSPNLRSKKELIMSFINEINNGEDIRDKFREFFVDNREDELDEIIKEENLNEEKTKRFMNNCFENGSMRTTGTDIKELMPPTSRFLNNNNYYDKRDKVVDKLQKYFEKYFV